MTASSAKGDFPGSRARLDSKDGTVNREVLANKGKKVFLGRLEKTGFLASWDSLEAKVFLV